MHEMRRIKQSLPQEEIIEILNQETSGVLGLNGDDGYPYTIPLSFIYFEDKLYFHSSASGYKIDAIKNNPKSSFTIIVQDIIVPEDFTTLFKSIIITGKTRIIEDEQEKRKYIRLFTHKYSPDYDEESHRRTQGSLENMAMIEMTIEHLTSKESSKLMRQRSQGDHHGH